MFKELTFCHKDVSKRTSGVSLQLRSGVKTFPADKLKWRLCGGKCAFFFFSLQNGGCVLLRLNLRYSHFNTFRSNLKTFKLLKVLCCDGVDEVKTAWRLSHRCIQTGLLSTRNFHPTQPPTFAKPNRIPLRFAGGPHVIDAYFNYRAGGLGKA